MSIGFYESLERRVLFAGVTLITHGRDGHLWGFNDEASKDITARLGGASQVPWYILKLVPDNSDGHLIPSITRVNNSTTPQDNKNGEIIVEIDWTSVDTRPEYPLSYIAGIVTDYMENTPVDGIRLASLPVHGLSISRGTGLIDEIAKSLGKAGIWVDQETYCDPNPVEQMGDAPPTIYDNVAFVDNYWRTDGNPDNFSTNGQAVDGAYNLHVQWLDNFAQGWVLKHLVPAGYYVGTIDTKATWGGEGPIYPSDWYGDTPDKPARTQTGFIYTEIVGAPRPLSGVWEASGGSGSRTPTGQEGQQWANVTDLSVNGDSTLHSGERLSLKYIHQDRDSGSTVSFYVDNDRNPFNGVTKLLGSIGFGSSDTIDGATTVVATKGVSPGKYRVLAKIADADGHVRYSYGGEVTITDALPTDPPPPPPLDAHVDGSGILRVVGTTGDDVVRVSISPSASDKFKVTINGRSGLFARSQVSRIYLYGLAGDDSLAINQSYGKIDTTSWLMGGSGDDILMGASGNDQLYGDAGNDRLYGGDGRDRVDGGDGTDQLWGQAGKDAFIKPDQSELMDWVKGESKST